MITEKRRKILENVFPTRRAGTVIPALGALVAVLGAAWTPTAVASGDGWAVGIQIPVIVNIYDSAATEPEVREAIKEANMLLTQAGMKLVVVRNGIRNVQQNDGGADHWGGDDGSGGGTAGDGVFTAPEQLKVLDYGAAELVKTPEEGGIPNKRGIKIAFAEETDAGKGASIHRKPTIIVRKSTACEGGMSDTGQTIAHELGHIMTLGANHLVDAGPPEVRADQDAHSAGADHIMQTSGRGDQFTKAQRQEMKRNKYVRGKCSTQWKAAFPATKDKEGHGAGADARGDHAGGGRGGTPSPIYDLLQVSLTSLDETEVGGDRTNINTQITVAGVLPTDEDIDATYSIGFDIDDSSATGVTYAGYDGIDRLVYVYAAGNIGLGTFTLSGEVEDTVLEKTDSLPETPVAEIEDEFNDPVGGAFANATSFLFKIPKSMLNFEVTDVPAVVAAGAGVDIFDTMVDLIFDSDEWIDNPSLDTFGTGVPTPGGSYLFEISGLTPNDEFDLFLDDTLIMSGTLDGFGEFSGEFIFPIDLSSTETHFLTALDSTAEFAYSITCPQGGACCQADGTCIDGQTSDQCIDPTESFFANLTCAEVTCPTPTGACCLSKGNCFEGLILECSAAGGTYRGDHTTCQGDNNGNGIDDACEEPIKSVPTLSEWGLIAMALLLLTTGTIVLARRRGPAAT